MLNLRPVVHEFPRNGRSHLPKQIGTQISKPQIKALSKISAARNSVLRALDMPALQCDCESDVIGCAATARGAQSSYEEIVCDLPQGIARETRFVRRLSISAANCKSFGDLPARTALQNRSDFCNRILKSRSIWGQPFLSLFSLFFVLWGRLH